MGTTGPGFLQARQQQMTSAAKKASLDEVFSKMDQMSSNGAPPDVLKRYLDASGVTPDEFNRHAANVWVREKQPGGAFGGFIRQMSQGALLGFADEITSGLEAGVRAPFEDKTFSQLYGELLAGHRQQDTAMQTAHPVASAVANVAGAVPMVVTTGGLGGGGAATTSGAVLRGAGTGAAWGGAAGFGASEGGLENRAVGAGQGALIGGVLGGAIPAIGTVGKRLGARIRAALGRGNADDVAVQKVLQAMARDKLTPDEAAQRYMQALAVDPKKPIALADVGGENMRRAVDQAFINPGPAADDIAERFVERQAGQGQRVMADVGKFLPDENLYASRESLMTQRSTDAAPLYEKAFAMQRPNITPRVQRFLDDPVTQEAFAKGVQIQRLEAVAAGKPFYLASGEAKIAKYPNMRMLDAVKRGLDEMVEAYRDPTTLKLVLNEQGRALDGFRRAWVAELDKINPDYAAARAAWGGPSQALDAISLGRGVFNKDAEITVKSLREFPDSMKEFYRIGVFRAILDKVQSAPDGADVLKRFFGNPGVRSRISAAFPSAEDFQQFQRLMDIEKTMFKTGQQVMGNSKTAQRLAGMADANAETLNAAGQVIVDGWKSALMTMLRRSIVSLGGMKPEVADRISTMLLEGSPQQVIQALKRLQLGTVAREATVLPASGGVLPALTGATAGQQRATGTR